MAKFSQRYGYTSAEKAFERETVSSELRTALWNVLNVCIWDNWAPYDYGWTGESERINELVRRLWIRHFNADLDQLPAFKENYSKDAAYDRLKRHFMQGQWYEVFDFLEFLAQDKSGFFTKEVAQIINSVFERENSPYRLVSDEVVEITDANQIAAINKALEAPSQPVKSHLGAALAMLSDKKNPDYRNSIKESISAVEAACREVSGQSKATLGDALKRIAGLHPALQKAFLSLYGYTNDAEGIRHALLDEPKLTKSDAVFMLVACSAFIGFLYENK